jgi:hypothetical protein
MRVYIYKSVDFGVLSYKIMEAFTTAEICRIDSLVSNLHV